MNETAMIDYHNDMLESLGLSDDRQERYAQDLQLEQEYVSEDFFLDELGVNK